MKTRIAFLFAVLALSACSRLSCRVDGNVETCVQKVCRDTSSGKIIKCP